MTRGTRADRGAARIGWLRDADGRLTLAQWPNPALSVWLVSVVVGWLSGVLELSGEHRETVRLLGQGALIAWALDELVRGASLARRALGLVVLVAMLARIFG